MRVQSQPPIVWSLLDLMHYFDLWRFVNALDMLKDSSIRCADVINNSRVARDFPIPKEIADYIGPELLYLREKCVACELSNATRRIDEKVIGGLRGRITLGDLLAQFTELKRDIDNDLEFRKFIFIPASEAQLLDGLDAQWEAIWKAIPASEKDARDAALCYAVGLPSAAIFHAMRVAEFGLRHLAAEMKVSILDKGKKIPIEFGTWEKVIANCKSKIDAARKLPTNATKEKRLQFYSRAADHAGYMKDIWRNDISHTRKSYIDPEAKAVLDRVHGFMEFLSAGA